MPPLLQITFAAEHSLSFMQYEMYHIAGTALFGGHGHAIASLLQEFSVTSQCIDIMLQLLLCLSQDMKHGPILQMGSDKMLPKNVYHKPFTVMFPDK